MPQSSGLSRWHVALVCGLVALGLLLHYGGEKPVIETVAKEEDHLMDKQRLRTVAKEGWKGEAWMDGSSCPVYYPVYVWVRLTPDAEDDPRLPKTVVHLRLIQADGAVVRQVQLEPQFQQCAKMKPRKETTYEPETRTWGPITTFPPKGPCWEAIIRDPFQSDRRRAGAAPLPAGDYLLSVEVSLDDCILLAFDLMPIHLYRDRIGKL